MPATNEEHTTCPTCRTTEGITTWAVQAGSIPEPPIVSSNGYQCPKGHRWAVHEHDSGSTIQLFSDAPPRA